MAWVLFDDETILFGDAPSVFAALDRNQFRASVPARANSGPCGARGRNGGQLRLLGDYGRYRNHVE